MVLILHLIMFMAAFQTSFRQSIPPEKLPSLRRVSTRARGKFLFSRSVTFVKLCGRLHKFMLAICKETTRTIRCQLWYMLGRYNSLFLWVMPLSLCGTNGIPVALELRATRLRHGSCPPCGGTLFITFNRIKRHRQLDWASYSRPRTATDICAIDDDSLFGLIMSLTLLENYFR